MSNIFFNFILKFWVIVVISCFHLNYDFIYFWIQSTSRVFNSKQSSLTRILQLQIGKFLTEKYI